MSFNSIRIRRSYRNHTLYIILTYDRSNNVYAIQVSVSNKEINQDAKTLSGIESMSRLTTMALQAYPLEKVVKELRNGSLTKNDLAGMFADVIEIHKDAYKGFIHKEV